MGADSKVSISNDRKYTIRSLQGGGFQIIIERQVAEAKAEARTSGKTTSKTKSTPDAKECPPVKQKKKAKPAQKPTTAPKVEKPVIEEKKKEPEPKKTILPNTIEYDKDYKRPNLGGLNPEDPCFEECVEPKLKKYDIAIPKAMALLDNNTSGKVGAQEWAAILLVKDLYRTQKNYFSAKQGEKEARVDAPSQFLEIPESGDYSNTLFRYSHWDDTLEALGLDKYKGKLQPPGIDNANFYNGVNFKTGVPKLLEIIRKDLGAKAEGLSDVQVLKLAGAKI